MIGNLGAGFLVKRDLGDLLVLSVLAMRAEYEKRSDQKNANNDDDDQSNHKLDHSGGKGWIRARIVSDNEFKNCRHDSKECIEVSNRLQRMAQRNSNAFKICFSQ